jgi:outer membrane protein OmpA-like peptidoglycan-associated protein
MNAFETRPPTFASARLLIILLTSLAALGGTACAPAARPDTDMPRAVYDVVMDLSQQLGPTQQAMRTLVIDPLLDARTGQQTKAAEQVEVELARALAGTMQGLAILPFKGEGAAQSRFLLTGTVTKLPETDRFRLGAAVSNRDTGLVVAQAVATFVQPGMSAAPTKFYADSPSLTRDRSVEGQLRTAETSAGSPADALYIEQVPTSALLASALTAYNAQQWEQALEQYTAAVQRPDGQQLRTFNGIYLCNIQLGRMAEAEQAFAKIAALGLATNNLAVKLLFRPGRTDFWPDPKVSSLYPMWLRLIATAVRKSESCLSIVGHTSRSGSDAVNDKLSLARASTIRDRLEREAPGIASRASVKGLGSRENLIGSGTDDTSDALDRRVEFKVTACGDVARRSAAPAPSLAAPAGAPVSASTGPATSASLPAPASAGQQAPAASAAP